MTATEQVHHDAFQHHIAAARAASSLIAENTSPSHEYPRFGATYYLTRDRLSGYGVLTDGGTLVGLFSLVRGRGDALMASAIADGARQLDCFDGFLPGFYARHSFAETRREANWVDGEPDVVFMELSEETLKPPTPPTDR